MSTIEDFENAPGGATATNEYGMRAMKLNQWGRWASQTGGIWDSGDMERYRYTLDPVAPTTAREALTLAWELSDPMKQGNDLPIGTECIAKVRDGEFMVYRSEKPFDGVSRPGWAEARTLDPLPDPEPGPDWLDAPAVIAHCDYCSREGYGPQMTLHRILDGQKWECAECQTATAWSNLRGVTPLYPKGQDA